MAVLLQERAEQIPCWVCLFPSVLLSILCCIADRKIDESRRPGLGIYMWADGAAFQDVVNLYMGEEFPYGMDPTETNDDPMDLQISNRNATSGLGSAGLIS